MNDNAIRRKNAFRLIVLMGMVSLFADVTYEGARSITGPYLSLLGASAAAVGFVGGLGELFGYGLRLFSGYLADRTGRHWLIAILGYVVNLLAVPLLALAGRWEVAALLIVAERLGKAIRAPSRDAILSHASRQVGSGVGFGLHETLDQIGALTGPLVVAGVLYLRGGQYRPAFAVLLAPALVALVFLAVSRALYPRPETLEAAPDQPVKRPDDGKLPRVFWMYTLFTAASIGGFAHFQMVSYHFKVQGVVPDPQIPVLFAVAMGVDALVALPAGHLFDRKGLLTLAALPVLAVPLPFLVFSRSYHLAIAGMVLWGVATAVQETIMRAGIAELIPATRRGVAYGIFNTVFGVAWFAGSTVMGVLYELGIPYVILFALVMELASVPLIFLVARSAHTVAAP